MTLTWTYIGSKNTPHGINVVELSQYNSLLSIRQVAEYHRGIYICTATNDVGEHSIQIPLIVYGMFRFYSELYNRLEGFFCA